VLQTRNKLKRGRGQSITTTFCSDLIYVMIHVEALARTYTKITSPYDNNFLVFYFCYWWTANDVPNVWLLEGKA